MSKKPLLHALEVVEFTKKFGSYNPRSATEVPHACPAVVPFDHSSLRIKLVVVAKVAGNTKPIL